MDDQKIDEYIHMADRYSRKLHKLISKRSDIIMNDEPNVVLALTFESLASKMICSALILHKVVGIDDEETVLRRMLSYAIDFKNEHCDNIEKVFNEGKETN